MIGDAEYGPNYCCQDDYRGKSSCFKFVQPSSALAQYPPWGGRLAYPLAALKAGERMTHHIEKGEPSNIPDASSLGINAIFRN